MSAGVTGVPSSVKLAEHFNTVFLPGASSVDAANVLRTRVIRETRSIVTDVQDAVTILKANGKVGRVVKSVASAASSRLSSAARSAFNFQRYFDNQPNEEP